MTFFLTIEGHSYSEMIKYNIMNMKSTVNERMRAGGTSLFDYDIYMYIKKYTSKIQEIDIKNHTYRYYCEANNYGMSLKSNYVRQTRDI